MTLICAFCTEETTQATLSSQSLNYLESFYTEFITDPPTCHLQGVGGNINVPIKNNVPLNWSLCTNCFSSVELLLKSKRSVDKVECQVRKLQESLLTELKRLSKQVDIMSSNMTVVEGILKRNAEDYFPNVWKEVDGKKTRKGKEEIEEEAKLVEGFRNKVVSVFQDFQNFKGEIKRKLVPVVVQVKGELDRSSVKSVEDLNQKPENEAKDNMSDFDNIDDNSPEEAYHEDKVKPENSDSDHDQDDKLASEDNHLSNSSGDDDDEEFLPKKKIKSSSIWTPSKSKKKSSCLFTCDVCLKPLKNGPALRSHIWSHLSIAEKEDPANEHLIPKHIHCKICRKEFRHNNLLRRHQQIHLNREEREKIICQDCGVVVLALSYPYHKKHHCVNSKSYSHHGVKCPICEKLQKNTRVLVKHLVKAHPNDKHYPCDICGVRFRTKGQVHSHKKTHDQVASYLCQGCGRGFKCSNNLKRHEKLSCPGTNKNKQINVK